MNLGPCSSNILRTSQTLRQRIQLALTQRVQQCNKSLTTYSPNSSQGSMKNSPFVLIRMDLRLKRFQLELLLLLTLINLPLPSPYIPAALQV